MAECWFTDLTGMSHIYHWNNHFLVCCEAFSSLTVPRDFQHVSTINHAEADGRVLNDFTLCRQTTM